MTLDEIERYRALQQEILDIGYAMLGDRPRYMPTVKEIYPTWHISHRPTWYTLDQLPKGLRGTLYAQRLVWSGEEEALRFSRWDGT